MCAYSYFELGCGYVSNLPNKEYRHSDSTAFMSEQRIDPLLAGGSLGTPSGSIAGNGLD
jgi:hypothetical protein